MVITAATLAMALLSAHPGDTLTLSGPFGDAVISGKAFSPAITLASDPANPATFRTLAISKSTGIHVQSLHVAFTPDAKTMSWTAAVTVSASSDVRLAGLSVVGGPAVNGVPETAAALDGTGNVIGRPAGYGVYITASHDVGITDSEVSKFHRLIVLNTVANVLVQHNNLHDRRTTAVQGAGLTDITVDANIIADANPWNWGHGDHADCLAFWSNANQTTPNARVRVTNNRMAQTSGVPILGMWFQGSAAAPFTDFEISGNTLLIPNNQGILLTYSSGGRIANNTLIQAQVAAMTPEQLTKQRPSILLRAGVTGVAMTGNSVSAPIDDRSGGVNSQTGTALLSGFVSG